MVLAVELDGADVESMGTTARTSVGVAARMKAADELVVEMAPPVGKFAAPELAHGAAHVEVGDGLVVAAADAPAWSCGRGEVRFVGEEPDAVSFLFASARYAAHSRSQSSGSAMAKSRIAFRSSLSFVMAFGGGGKNCGEFCGIGGGIGWL
jgi:hypothetical protein